MSCADTALSVNVFAAFEIVDRGINTVCVAAAAAAATTWQLGLE
jgi:hypothetical protein